MVYLVFLWKPGNGGKSFFFTFLQIAVVNPFIISTKLFKREQPFKVYQVKIAKALLGDRFDRIKVLKLNSEESHYPELITTK